MAFRTFSEQHNRPTQPVSEAARPQMMPLSLELLPPVLCQSFGVPMNESQLMSSRGMLGFSVQEALRQCSNIYGQPEQRPGQFMTPSQHMSYSMGALASYGQMAPLGYPLGGPMPYASAQCGPSPQQQAQQQPSVQAPSRQSSQQPVPTARGVKRADPVAPASPSAESMEPIKRSRLVWTRDLHMRFEAAVDKAGGIDVAVPKTVLEHMSVAGLTRDNVASHLQKHRMHVKKSKEGTNLRSGGATRAQSTQELTTTTSATPGRPAQRSSTECEASGAVSIGATTGTESRAPQYDGQSSGRGKADASASAHFTSDSGSRKTAFAMAMRSGVHSTPESRDTCTGGGRAGDAAFGSNMASSTCHMVALPAAAPRTAPRPADILLATQSAAGGPALVPRLANASPGLQPY